MAPSQCTEEFIEGARVVAVSFENLTSEPSARPPYEGLVARGAFTHDDVTRFGAVIKGEANPRRNESDTVVYQLEGGTVQDLYVATWGYEWARERGLGLAFDLRS
jgi:ornithine cyclodeaminase/alanine dehydrogenase-like protein (mu-crystallin family)